MSSGTHNAYRNMVANVPEGFAFVESKFTAPGIVQAARRVPLGSAPGLKPLVRSVQSLLSPYYNHAHILLNRPKLREFHSDDADLVHSGQSLLDSNVPYVVDFEHAAVFCGFNQYGLRRPSFVRNLEQILLNKNLRNSCLERCGRKKPDQFRR